MYRYFKLTTNTSSILSWSSKGLSNENIDSLTTSLSPSINYVGNKIRVKFTKMQTLINMDILAMELDLIEEKFFISKWRIWSKCITFWSRYEFFCTH